MKKKFKTFGAVIRTENALGHRHRAHCSNSHSLLIEAVRLSVEEVGRAQTEARLTTFLKQNLEVDDE